MLTNCLISSFIGALEPINDEVFIDVEPLHLGSIDVLAALIKGAVNFGFSVQNFFRLMGPNTFS